MHQENLNPWHNESVRTEYICSRLLSHHAYQISKRPASSKADRTCTKFYAAPHLTIAFSASDGSRLSAGYSLRPYDFSIV